MRDSPRVGSVISRGGVAIVVKAFANVGMLTLTLKFGQPSVA
jgi:hypothetical protein